VSLETQNGRASAIHIALPWRGLFPDPDAVINANDRAHVAGYFGARFAPVITSTIYMQKPVDYALAGEQYSFKSGRASGRGLRHAFGE
jgi:hypothetical protein